MALSRLAAQFAAEIALHDWSDAPFRADRAGHRRENDSPSKVANTPQLDRAQTECVKVNAMWVTAQVLAYNDPNFDVNEFARACGIGEYNAHGRRWGRGIEAGLRGQAGNYAEPGLLVQPAATHVKGEVNSKDCSHPARGGQERILGSGSGDYFCVRCDLAMPVIAKPKQCAHCRSTDGDISPDLQHGQSWQCFDCSKNWGWVKK